MKKRKMKAMIATGYGSSEVLKLREVDLPAIKPTEVLIKVAVSSATTADGMMLSGKPFITRLFVGLTKPKYPIPGTGFAGVVHAKGSEVSKFKVGDKVFGETTLGFSTNAEFLAVPENGVILPMPETMQYTEAASFGDGHVTSYNFLTNIYKLKASERILIIGASGALGTAAVQIAKYKGAHVTGVCSSKNKGLVKSLGADEIIDYTVEDFTNSTETYDVIFDTLGKTTFKACQKILNPHGHYLSPVIGVSVLFQMMKTSLFGSKKVLFHATGTNSENKLRAMLEEVTEIFKSGKLKTVIDRQYPLEKLAEAYTYIAKGHKKGNVIIINTQDNE
ncbi:MAG: NAD(P)-dependent alcohol dehydrogenase [Cytophagales bacterium]|nr:NAD(P)-dependent alcohol dehydrogenase [Cytophagales bacterium]